MSSSSRSAIERQIDTHPGARALVEGAEQITYGELGTLAGQLVTALQSRGVTMGSRVVTKLHTRWEWFAINLALARLGALHVSASWGLTDREITHVLREAGAKVLIHDGSASAVPAGLDVEHEIVIGEADGAASLRATVAGVAPSWARASGPATLVIFTAGTSGLPKGAVIDFGRVSADDPAMQAYLADQRRVAPSGPWMRSLMCRPLHHLAGPVQGRSCLDNGGTLFVLRKFEAETVLALTAEHQLTHLSMVPTMARRLLNLPSDTRARYDVSSVRSLHVGGAPVPFELKEQLIAMFGDACLYEGYGSTELRYVTVMPPSDHLRKPGSCGRPYAGVDLRIVDDAGQDVPNGEAGEIWVRTPVRFAGYLNRAPAESGIDSDGFFHTGDLGRLDDDGYLYVSGRKSDMIIRGGVNVYPAEIEAELVKHPAVNEAAVVGVAHEDLGEVPKAYCELKPGALVTADELRAFLGSRLAPYKVPSAFEFVASLPRSAMGKVLKRELRHLEGARG